MKLESIRIFHQHDYIRQQCVKTVELSFRIPDQEKYFI